MPPEIIEYILDFIRPYLTRDDWRTCSPAAGIRTLIDRVQKGGPRNSSHPVAYPQWSFYEKVRFSKVKVLKSPYSH